MADSLLQHDIEEGAPPADDPASTTIDLKQLEEGAPLVDEPVSTTIDDHIKKVSAGDITAITRDSSPNPTISDHSSDCSSTEVFLKPRPGLRPSLSKPAQKDEEDVFHENGEKSHDDHHGHAAANPSYKSYIASAVVCFIIYFVFCIVFASVVWDPLNSSLDTTINPPFGVSQGVGINLMGIAVGSVFFAWKSGCKAIIAGPDLLPIVFFAEAGTSVVTYLAAQSAQALRSQCAGAVADGAAHRFLGGGGAAASSDPCELFHRHLAGSVYLDEASISKVVPTTLVVMMIGNLVTASVFYGLGKAKNTASVIGCIPASVVGGFLTCIGYKV
jgi:hypothetical protein